MSTEMQNEKRNQSDGDVQVKVPAILYDLIPKYLENRRKEIQNLNEAIEAQDFSTIQSIGHKLKGNAGSYGFFLLTEVGALLEKAGKEKDLESALASVSTYASFLDHVRVSSV